MTTPFGTAAAGAAADAIRAGIGAPTPTTALILGSGLGAFAEGLHDPVRIPYANIPGFPASTVVGHSGALIAGWAGGARAVVLAGRFHIYERDDAALAAFPTRVVGALGVRNLIVTNAAGGIRPSFRAGDLMLIDDHINLLFRNPLIGPPEPGDLRFPDMSAPYDADLAAVAIEAATAAGLLLHRGVYVSGPGPSYETRSEIAAFARLGADAVGMSTVPEVVAARAIGLRVLGISCITNLACGIASSPLTHHEVLETGAAVSARLTALLSGIVSRLG